MKNTLSLLTILLLFYSAYSQKKYKYPQTEKDQTFDIYFSDTIVDPYQWMEDPTDPRLEKWLDEQKDFTTKLSNKQTRFWDLRAQLVSMYNEVKRNSYTKRDKESKSKYEFKREYTGYNKPRDLYYKKRDEYNFKPLIKAKDFIENKSDNIEYCSINVDNENDLVVVNISINGSDWNRGYIFDLKDGKQLPYIIDNLKSGVEWHDNSLYYFTFDTPAKGRELLDKAKGQKLYRFKIGKDSIPELLYTNIDTVGTNPFSFSIRDNKLFLYHFLISRGNYYKAISCANLKDDNFFPKNFLVYPNEETINLSIAYVSNDSVWLTTNWNAPNGKVLLANLNYPNKLTEFVPQYDIVLSDVNKLGKDKLACIYLHEGINSAIIYNMKGDFIKKIDFPKGKKLNYFYENNDVENTYFSISSFYHPQLNYKLSLESLEFLPIETLYVPYDVLNLETRYVTYKSKDGTEIPMYITCKKDIKLNGKNPVMIYGYGGYGTTVEPFYNESNALFIAHGGILAVPNIRGGGAKGADWALKGRRLSKQNAIDDFIGATEYLINEKYSKPNKIVINGKSHGGMLVMAAMVQRPELFKAVIAEAGISDMLRFHNYTIGNVNTNIIEFGTPEIEEDYENLKSYSPLHNLKKDVKYPNLLLITGNSDDRVPPFHSYKFSATLQEKADKTGLYSLYVVDGAGHGEVLTQEDFEDLLLFKYYFIFDNLKIDFY